jgi:hypothetical protein
MVVMRRCQAHFDGSSFVLLIGNLHKLIERKWETARRAPAKMGAET